MPQDDIILVPDALERLQKYGSVSADSLQRLRDKGLVPKSTSLGHGGGNYYTLEQFEHICNVHILQNGLGEKWTFPELAFWMAYHGMRDVPPYLVAEHIQFGVALFFRSGRTMADRLGTGRVEHRWKSADQSDAMASLMAKKFFRESDPEIPRIKATREILRIMISVFVGVWYFDRPFSEYSSRIRNACFLLVPEADAFFSHIYQWLDKEKGMLSSKMSKNSFSQAAHKALHKDPKIVVRGAKDAQLLHKLLDGALADIPMPDAPMKKTSALHLSRSMRGYIPMLAAFSIDLQLINTRNEFLLELRKGQTFNMQEWVNRLNRIGVKALERSRRRR